MLLRWLRSHSFYLVHESRSQVCHQHNRDSRWAFRPPCQIPVWKVGNYRWQQQAHGNLCLLSTRQPTGSSACFIMLMTHLCSGLMDQENWMISLNTSRACIPTSNSAWRLSWMATSPSWTSIYTEDHSDTLYTGSWPTATSDKMLSYTIIQWISIPCCPPWHNEIESSGTRRVCHENWNFSVVCSNRMATMMDTSFVLSIHLRGMIQLEIFWHHWPSCPLQD